MTPTKSLEPSLLEKPTVICSDDCVSLISTSSKKEASYEKETSVCRQKTSFPFSSVLRHTPWEEVVCLVGLQVSHKQDHLPEALDVERCI